MRYTSGGLLKSLLPVMALILALFVALLYAEAVRAERFVGPSSIIDASVGNTFGGSVSGGSYRMETSGGEAIVGSGSGGSYKLTQGYVAQLEKSLQLSVQPVGLAAYYPLDEGLGLAVNDATTNNNHSSSVNAPAWATGKKGQALDFDGVDDYVVIPHSSSIALTNNLTISFWAKVYSLSSGGTFIHKEGSYGISYNTAGAVIVTQLQGGSLRAGSSSLSAVTVGEYVFIAVTKSGGSAKVYINGTLNNTLSNFQASDSNTSTLYVGSQYAATSPLNGSLDEVKIFSRALTAHEIAAEYTAGNSGQAAGLAFANNVVTGAPQNMEAQAVIQTDASGYNLAISQNQNLTSESNTIPAVSNGGTIASPAAWSNGITTGLGFTLTATNATAIPGKWSSGSSYAAIPGSATTFYSRTGYTAGAKDALTIRYRLDVPASQVSGTYTNTVTYTGTVVP